MSKTILKNIGWCILITIGIWAIGESASNYWGAMHNLGGIVAGAVMVLIGLRFLLFPKK